MDCQREHNREIGAAQTGTPLTVRQVLYEIARELAPVAGDYALPEAERILTFLLNCPRSDLYLSSQGGLPAEVAGRVRAAVARRQTDMPLAYVLGSAYFYNREFFAAPGALIPRPDTETVVEHVLLNEGPSPSLFLDLCTGSGCIAAVLTGQNPAWQAVAIDISPAALAVAKRNCGERVRLLCADGFSAFGRAVVFDFIVCNPPYIASPAIQGLPASVRDFEPIIALDGLSDGLAFYRLLAAASHRLLKPGCRIYCEIGYDQGTAVRAIFTTHGWSDLQVKKDNAGNDRVVLARKPEGKTGDRRQETPWKK